jgi:hypothetical protein
MAAASEEIIKTISVTYRRVLQKEFDSDGESIDESSAKVRIGGIDLLYRVVSTNYFDSSFADGNGTDDEVKEELQFYLDKEDPIIENFNISVPVFCSAHSGGVEGVLGISIGEIEKIGLPETWSWDDFIDLNLKKNEDSAFSELKLHNFYSDIAKFLKREKREF